MTTQPAETTRYVAFLRAINVGGRTVKMDALRALFVEIGFTNVATLIASGNVIFDAPADDTRHIEIRIEQHLESTLGYRVDTFIRTIDELASIASTRPFAAHEMDDDDTTLYVAFLNATPAPTASQTIADLTTATDTFHLHDRELYWLVRGRISQSTITGTILEKALGVPTTLRNANTVHRLIAKYRPEHQTPA